MLAPEEEYYLYQNMHLMFESARLSLLNEDQAGFRDALSRAGTWLVTYFEMNAGPAPHMATELAQLQDQPVVWQLPDISASLRLLRQQAKRMAQEAAS